jgi:hypothetical protein
VLSFQVHSSLALSILSVLSALTGIAILSVSLAALEPALQQCKLAFTQLDTTQDAYHFFSPEPLNSCFVAKAALTVSISKGNVPGFKDVF